MCVRESLTGYSLAAHANKRKAWWWVCSLEDTRIHFTANSTLNESSGTASAMGPDRT